MLLLMLIAPYCTFTLNEVFRPNVVRVHMEEELEVIPDDLFLSAMSNL